MDFGLFSKQVILCTVSVGFLWCSKVCLERKGIECVAPCLSLSNSIVHQPLTRMVATVGGLLARPEPGIGEWRGQSARAGAQDFTFLELHTDDPCAMGVFSVLQGVGSAFEFGVEPE